MNSYRRGARVTIATIVTLRALIRHCHRRASDPVGDGSGIVGAVVDGARMLSMMEVPRVLDRPCVRRICARRRQLVFPLPIPWVHVLPFMVQSMVNIICFCVLEGSI